MNTHRQETIDEVKKVGIIGGGRGGTALLQTLNRLPQVIIVGICDIDSHAPALDLARASGIETYTEMEQLVDAQPVDWLINATNRSIAQRHILSLHYDNVTLIDGHIAELIWQLLIDFEKVLARDCDQQGNDIKEATLNTLKWTLTQRIVDNAQPVQNELEYIAFHDPLTGLYSRQMLLEFSEREISLTYRHERPLSMVVFDIDHFKRVNDIFGHNAGDVILKQLADLISASCRRSDMAARYGGEEFVVILPNTDLTSTITWAERVREKTACALLTPDGTRVTVSLGIACLEFAAKAPSENDEQIAFEAFFKRADQMLYEAKRAGRNCVASTRVTVQHRTDAASSQTH